MVVKVLVENTEHGEFCGEHGLCLYVEYKGKNYLIDSGSSELFAENASRMGVALENIHTAFLSHAHYDHAGGYSKFFQSNQQAKVYIQAAAKQQEFYKITDEVKKYIGMPKGMLEQYKNRFTYIDGATNIEEGIYIIPHSSEKTVERAKHTHMCVIADGQILYDDFSHEQIVVFEEEDGLICFNSCSHAGVDISIEEVKAAFPNKKIKAYFGGFHMMGATGVNSCSYSKEGVCKVAEKIKEATDATFYSGHCTGTIAFEWLKEVLGDRLEKLYSGRVISFTEENKDES